MDQIRWGMVSAGNIAGQFASDIKLVGNAHVAAVAARNGDAAKRFANEHGIQRAYEGYQALYDDPNIDAIYISTPHNFHLQNSLDAFSGGKAVLCEKPITTNRGDLEHLIREAKKADCYVMEAMWTWFLPAIHQAKKWVQEGRIGELLHVNANFGFRMKFNPASRLHNPDLAGGCLLDTGIYPIALAQYFIEQLPRTITTLTRFADTGVDDDIVMQFKYDQCTASLATSFRAQLPNIAYLIGTEGIIVIPNFWRANECHLYVAEECVASFDDRRKGRGFEFQIQAVSQDIIEGSRESATVNHQASLSFQQVMDRVRAQF